MASDKKRPTAGGMCAVVEGVQGRGTWRGFGGGLQLHAPELGISLAGEDAMRGADWLSAPIRGEPFGEGSWGLVKNAHLSQRPSHSPLLLLLAPQGSSPFAPHRQFSSFDLSSAPQ